MKAAKYCIECLTTKNSASVSQFDEYKQKRFFDGIKSLLDGAENESAPYLQSRIDLLFTECFGVKKEYASIKEKYNRYLLSKEEEICRFIRESDDVIEACIRFACAGNYIDFGAMEEINDSVLERILEKAKNDKIAPEVLVRFKAELEKGGKLVYLHDNCGEVVLDKIFIRFLRELYPKVEITSVVRGADTFNDATMDDAQAVGLVDIVKVIGNGTAIPGTSVAHVNDITKKALEDADVIISKGQGNFETVYGEGFNTYFLFMCKCRMFVERFGLAQFSTVFANEKDIVTIK